MLNNKDLKELISATRQHINLRETVIEKDYYVTQIIHAIANMENEYFRLVFCGGTCLAKAHKIIKRMSEDVDFKIQIKNTGMHFSKTRLMKELKEFRTNIQSRLILPDMIIGDSIVRNEGKYSRIEVNYPSVFPSNAELRPHILLEFTLANIHLPIENLLVNTLIENTLVNTKIFLPTSTACLSVDETAIEKWVGLTRRIIAIERGYHEDDKTLVRHVYDLNVINHLNQASVTFFTLAKAIVSNDARQFINQHPEYSNNPGAEIMKSLELLRNKLLWKERYQEFINTMVYDDLMTLEYESAISVLEHISERMIDSLS